MSNYEAAYEKLFVDNLNRYASIRRTMAFQGGWNMAYDQQNLREYGY
ncbi:MAG: hypothetical protein HN416_12040 [Nitrospina sp.]|nr:hypothetical protein [Nitrospina sp.]